ncbi:hypothetical protein BGZ47_009034 [Haplosporangium gracile]|nr:hypothetical protein BGZ47_009034 [Haplosporangium gracile]
MHAKTMVASHLKISSSSSKQQHNPLLCLTSSGSSDDDETTSDSKTTRTFIVTASNAGNNNIDRRSSSQRSPGASTNANTRRRPLSVTNQQIPSAALKRITQAASLPKQHKQAQQQQSSVRVTTAVTMTQSVVSTPTTARAASPRSTSSSPTFSSSSSTSGYVGSEQDVTSPTITSTTSNWKRPRTQGNRLSNSHTTATKSGSRRSAVSKTAATAQVSVFPISSDSEESDTLSGAESDSHTLSDSRVPEISFVDISNDEGSGAEYDAASERGFDEDRDYSRGEVLASVRTPATAEAASNNHSNKHSTAANMRQAVTHLDTFGATRGRYLHQYHPHHPLAKAAASGSPGINGGRHTHTRNFSSPSLLDSFMSPEPMLSPIQSYFSDPNSPVSSYSLPRHDHYPRLSIDPYSAEDPTGASISLMDGYHGFATHPWSEQSTTPSRALSHRWTRRSSHPETYLHADAAAEAIGDSAATDGDKSASAAAASTATATAAAQAAAAAAAAAASMGMCQVR